MQETHLDVLKKKKRRSGRNLSRLMELGAESRDPSLSEKVWRKDFICRWRGGRARQGVQHAFKTPEPILQFKKAKVENVWIEI